MKPQPASRFATVLQQTSRKEQDYQALNVARNSGRIHVIPKLDDHVEIGFMKFSCSMRCRSIATCRGNYHRPTSTPLSHMNLLAKGWGVPNVYIKNAQELFKQYNGWWVEFDAAVTTIRSNGADNSALEEYQKRLKERLDVMKPALRSSVTGSLG